MLISLSYAVARPKQGGQRAYYKQVLSLKGSIIFRNGQVSGVFLEKKPLSKGRGERGECLLEVPLELKAFRRGDLGFVRLVDLVSGDG